MGPGVTIGDDPRVTPLGSMLRRTKLDELPQLLNVVRGEMSLVGPRPEDPRFVGLYSPDQRRVLEVRPGMTSPASVAFRDEQARLAGASEDDWERLRQAWGPDFEGMLAEVRARSCQLWIRLVGGSQVGFARNARRWWQPIQAALDQLGLEESPIYFVSSNVHSLVNVVSGVARDMESQIVDFARGNDPELVEELQKLDEGRSSASRENWLYYAARALFDGHPDSARLRAERSEVEQSVGIHHLAPPEGGVDSAAQVVRLNRLDTGRLDPRIGAVDPDALAASSAYILNVDYPLGLGAYHLLRQVAESVHWVDGVYLMGKAATLNAQVGDVMLPNVVYNEHSGNTYWLDNCFDAGSVQPYLEFGSALDHQRAVTVRGTFLQNRDYLDFYYQGRYTVVEMEVGPYLDACYEIIQPSRYPLNENVSMTQLTLDLGIIHYASDTPYTQARTLGARGLSYRGMDATYASSVAVMRRVLEQEGVLADAEARPAVPA